MVALTFDNGKEFANHQTVTSKAEKAEFFAEPYCPWQRASNENANGLIQRVFSQRNGPVSA
jgi:IS30 family transposase